MAGFRIIVWLMLLAPPLWAQAGDVAVVVNVKNPVTRLTMSDLRKIFAGEKRAWPGGIPVKLIIRATGTRERETALHLLRLSNEDFNRYWIAQIYRGEAAGPVTVFSNGMQKEAVISIPGAIALIAADDVRPGMKVLRIDDKLPGQEGYPLH
jgi:ABC-type phosphate transport system substrate-binding protein